MEKTVLISLPIEDLQTVIIDCVVACLRNYKPELNTTPIEPDRWLDLTELCQYHPDKPKQATVYEWVSKAQIPFHKSGKKLRFLKSEIDSWLKQGRNKTLAETAIAAEQYISKNRR